MTFDPRRIPTVAAQPSRGNPLWTDTAGAAGALSAPLVGNPGERSYITGLLVGGLGATAAIRLTCSVSGLDGGNRTFYVTVPAGVGTPIPQVRIDFDTPLKAANLGANITVNVPSFGAGNTDQWVVAWGYSIRET